MGLDIVICIDDKGNQGLTNAVSHVEVQEKMDQNSSFKLHFMVDICKEDIARDMDASTAPGKILSVLAKVKDDMVCLVKGPITQSESNLQHGGAGSWIQVQGEDMGYQMNRETKFANLSAVKDSDIVRKLISGNDNMTPDVEETNGTHEEENHSFVQTETDLQIIRRLGKQNGFHFWTTYTKEGKATGHFRPRDLNGNAKQKLAVNMADNNIDNLRIIVDSKRPTQTIGRQIDLRSKEEMGNDVKLNDTVLAKTGLSGAAGSNAQTMQLAPVVDSGGALKARSEAALKELQWFITATCKTSLQRLCDVLRSHTIVDVQGAGTKHSGKYYVTSVKHTIDAVGYTMDIELARNGWGI
jgi:phage protein D